jgi:hypothetical protein
LFRIAEPTGSGIVSRVGNVRTTAYKLMLKSLHRKPTEETAWDSKRPHGSVFERMMILIVVVVVDDFSLLAIYSVRVVHVAESYSLS